jgi:hypothetical protein
MYRRRGLLVIIALAAGCRQREAQPTDTRSAAGPTVTGCDAPELRSTVEQLGSRMKLVSLLAPAASVAKAMHEQYESLVTPELLAEWLATPSAAPGRAVSSPWPERIAIDSITSAGSVCRARGNVIYATSAGTVATATPITIDAVHQNGWRISAASWPKASGVAETATRPDAPAAPGPVDTGGSPATSAAIDTGSGPDADARAAVAVIQRYYHAIDDRRYSDAYMLWSDGGKSSGKTLDAFAAGFAETSHVTVTPGTPSRVEPAAGSRYISIPVTIIATTRGGATQRFTGVYQLRRAVVDGATAAQRSWRIYSASLHAS